MTIRVLIADDHPVFLDGLRLLLETTPDIEVVGAAADGDGLLELAATTAFDVAVLDLDMPNTDGAAAARALLETRADAAVLFLTMHDDDASLTRALCAGARGYVLKGAGHGSIARAIAAVHEGDTVLAGVVGENVLARARRPTAPPTSPALSGLTARELEILDLVARGLDNSEIARQLTLSIKTVQNNVSSLLAKLHANSRAKLLVKARDAGLGI